MNKNVKGEVLLISEWLMNHFIVSLGEDDDSKIYLGHFVSNKKNESNLKNYCNSFLNILVSIYLNNDVIQLSSSELEIKSIFLKYLNDNCCCDDILLNDSLSLLIGVLFNGKSDDYIEKNYGDIVKKMDLLGMVPATVLGENNYCDIFCKIISDNRNGIKKKNCYSIDYICLKNAYDEGLFYYCVVSEFKNFIVSSGVKSLELVRDIYCNSSFIYGDSVINSLKMMKK